MNKEEAIKIFEKKLKEAYSWCDDLEREFHIKWVKTGDRDAHHIHVELDDIKLNIRELGTCFAIITSDEES